MCNDLISRQAAIDAMDYCDFTKTNNDDTALYKYSVIDELQQLPSAQPERKKGHWIDTGEAIDNDTEVKCSECGEVLYWLSNFCPNCGCSMKEVKE